MSFAVVDPQPPSDTDDSDISTLGSSRVSKKDLLNKLKKYEMNYSKVTTRSKKYQKELRNLKRRCKILELKNEEYLKGLENHKLLSGTFNR